MKILENCANKIGGQNGRMEKKSFIIDKPQLDHLLIIQELPVRKLSAYYRQQQRLDEITSIDLLSIFLKPRWKTIECLALSYWLLIIIILFFWWQAINSSVQIHCNSIQKYIEIQINYYDEIIDFDLNLFCSNRWEFFVNQKAMSRRVEMREWPILS